ISRSYALRMRGSGVYSDVGTDQLTQVYGGYSAELIPGFDRVKQAVDNTRGEVILYNGQIVEAYYHASAGGHTENSENIWSAALPYLRAVPSPYDQYAIRYPYQSGGWPANTYDWAKKITRSQLASIIMDWNSRRLKDGRVNEIIDIGSLEGIEISRLDANGKETASQRVTELKFIGTTGKKSFYRDNIRSILGLKSTLFDIEFDSKITVLDGNASKVSFNSLKDLKAIDGSGALDYVNPDSDDCFVIGKESTRNIARSFDSLTIKGRGHGHGIGLSQWGAQGMAAEKGANYKEIIRHYYTGVDIKRVY
ncbi:MAG: SpoIID/LytB domain-containing protein, partial [Clostridia bacterium]|nr:SpoIID/LytB domain-containing protein [Clostridia bacterium]